MEFLDFVIFVEKNLGIAGTIILVLCLLIIFTLVNKKVKTKLLKLSKSKKQISNIKIFSRILNILFATALIIIVYFSYFGSWTGFGVVLGLITAGLGFALQKPITGIAAWIMVITKKPFQVGDKICIGNVKGEVYDISLFHIYLDEMGGIEDNSLHSGRNIMVPNYLLFEQNIINYTLTDDFVLEEVNFEVTYESDLDRAIQIAKETATKFLKNYLKEKKREISIRTKMEASSMKIRILFYAPIKEVYKISSDMTKEVYDRIKKEKKVEFAYPHTEVVFKNKKLFRK